MKKHKILLHIMGVILIITSFTLQSCKDDFADINTSPSSISETNPSYIFAEAVNEFEPSGYTYWYYNAAMTYKWGQTGVPTGGFTPDYTRTTATGDQGWKYQKVLLYVRDLANYRSKLSEEESAKYAGMAAALDVLTVYMGIFDTDMFGDIPFTEAMNARYGGTLTPKYDRVKELYQLWLKTLDDAIKTLSTSKDQVFKASQDVVYAGDLAKWAKLANSLKLKIAVRLLSQDKTQALKIASDVANAACGVLDGEADDMLFNKASSVTNKDKNLVYHWGNDVLQSTAASKKVVDFMIRNRDPRVRFFYKKNGWNSTIVQGFFDEKKDIPEFILDNVEYTVDADGKKTFVKWKNGGEPWVRYYGLPTTMSAADNATEYGDYFDYGNRSKLQDKKIYIPFSMFQEEMIRGQVDFTLPTLPDGPAIEDIEDNPWYGMYMSTSEVNLYLAEFKLLGAALPNTAQAYFTKGVEASVREYNKLAGLNKIPYYGQTYGYDPNEKVIDLQDGEIATMLTNTDYQLTGDNALDLEKVYIQQLIHFTLCPNDQFVTVRRSGCPRIGSSLIAWENFAEVGTNAVPRRFEVGPPSPTDLMFKNITDAYKAQGFTAGSDQAGTLLNSERVWQDKNAPQFGQGPKM